MRPSLVDMPMYCTVCGKEMKLTKLMRSSYDMLTGKQNYFNRLRCPNKKWYNNHDVVTLTQDGITYHI